jgi:hypothetical protein
MSRSDDRVRRLLARRTAKSVLGPLRNLIAVLSEWERLDGVDAIGVVQIQHGEPEANYGSSLLDITAQALDESTPEQVVEVFVTLTPIDQIHRPAKAIGGSNGRQQRKAHRV